MKYFLLLCAHFIYLSSIAQLTPELIKNYSENIPASNGLFNKQFISAFYKGNSYKPAWFGQSGPQLRKELFELIDSCGKVALEPSDYHLSTLKDKYPGSIEDSLSLDIRITDAAIHFLYDLDYGNKAPAISFRGFDFQPDISMINRYLNKYCSAGSLKGLVENIEPCSPEYYAAKKAYQEMVLQSKPVHIRELKTLVNLVRWIDGVMQESDLAIVNIPSANFLLFQENEQTLYSKVIVGKPSTRTPTLLSTIKEVIIYPYWNVPHKIATRELLPSIKRNIGYLESNNFQVINSKGQVINPYTISWRSLSVSNFPYRIRQSTGCDNSLGVLKFNFDNPFSVYLHDTPNKKLFSQKKRFFSHGCMRLEKPVELAQILLHENAVEIEKITRQCLSEQAPRAIAVKDPVRIIVLYSTAWFNENGEVEFFDDVYRMMKIK